MLTVHDMDHLLQSKISTELKWNCLAQCINMNIVMWIQAVPNLSALLIRCWYVLFSCSCSKPVILNTMRSSASSMVAAMMCTAISRMISSNFTGAVSLKGSITMPSVPNFKLWPCEWKGKVSLCTNVNFRAIHISFFSRFGTPLTDQKGKFTSALDSTEI